MTKSRDRGYQGCKARRIPTGTRGRFPVATDIRFAPCLNDGGINQFGIRRNGFHSTWRLRPHLRIAIQLAEQNGQQYEPNGAPGPDKRLSARMCAHLTIIGVAHGAGPIGMMRDRVFRDSTLRCANVSSFRLKCSSKARTSATGRFPNRS